MIDLHSHPLPGVDDGPPDESAALELARAAAAGGTEVLVATPHIDHKFGIDPERVPQLCARFAATVREAGVPLEIRQGGELSLARASELSSGQLAAARLGGGPYVLLECPHAGQAQMLEAVAFDLQSRGCRILLAHPERSPGVLADPGILERLVARGALAQVTAGALRGRYGSTVRRAAVGMLVEGLAHVVASDAHDAVRRGPEIRSGLEAVAQDVPGMPALGPWLTVDVPRAVLEGGPVPPRPNTPRRRRRLRLVRR